MVHLLRFFAAKCFAYPLRGRIVEADESKATLWHGTNLEVTDEVLAHHVSTVHVPINNILVHHTRVPPAPVHNDRDVFRDLAAVDHAEK